MHARTHAHTHIHTHTQLTSVKPLTVGPEYSNEETEKARDTYINEMTAHNIHSTCNGSGTNKMTESKEYSDYAKESLEWMAKPWYTYWGRPSSYVCTCTARIIVCTVGTHTYVCTHVSTCTVFSSPCKLGLLFSCFDTLQLLQRAAAVAELRATLEGEIEAASLRGRYRGFSSMGRA